MTTLWAPNRRAWSQDFTDSDVGGGFKTVTIYTGYRRYFGWGPTHVSSQLMAFDQPNTVRAGLAIYDNTLDLTVLEVACSLTTKRYDSNPSGTADLASLRTDAFDYFEYAWHGVPFESPIYYSINTALALNRWIEFGVPGLSTDTFWISAKVRVPASADLLGRVGLDAVAQITYDLLPYIAPPVDPPAPLTLTTPRRTRILATPTVINVGGDGQ